MNNKLISIIISLLVILGCKKEEAENLKPITDKEQAILDSLEKYDFTKFRSYTFEENKDKRLAAIQYNNQLFFRMYETFQGKNNLCSIASSGRTIEGDMIYSYYIVTPGEIIEVIDARRDMYGSETCVVKRSIDFFTLAQWKIIDNELERSILIEIDKDNYNKGRKIVPVFYKEMFAEIASAASKYEPVIETPPEACAFYSKGEDFEKAGEYEKADASYEKAIGLSQEDEFNAEVLFRLFQSKRKQGDRIGAKKVLKHLKDDFPPSTYIYTLDYPGPGFHSSWSLERICSEMNEFYSTLPVDVKVTALKNKYTTNEKAKFKVSIKNITTDIIKLVCSKQGKDKPLVPIERPYIIINEKSSTDFDESLFLSKAYTDVEIKPNETFSFIGSIGNLYNMLDKSGKYVFEFRMELRCKLNGGKIWENSILANSVVLEIDKYPSK